MKYDSEILRSVDISFLHLCHSSKGNSPTPANMALRYILFTRRGGANPEGDFQMDFFDVLPFEKGEGRDFSSKLGVGTRKHHQAPVLGWKNYLSNLLVLKVANTAGLHVSNI